MPTSMSCAVPRPDEATFDIAISSSPHPVLVHFAERGCEACELATVHLGEASDPSRAPVKCLCIHGTEHPGVVARYRVTQYPTILILREGRVARRLVGHPLPGELEVILRTLVR